MGRAMMLELDIGRGEQTLGEEQRIIVHHFCIVILKMGEKPRIEEKDSDNNDDDGVNDHLRLFFFWMNVAMSTLVWDDCCWVSGGGVD